MNEILPESERTALLTELATASTEEELRARLFGPDKLLARASRVISAADLQALIDVALQRLDDLRFNEFRDRSYADWKRARSVIEHENLLTNHRVTWLFSSQAFLLAAYTLVFNEWAKLVSNLGSTSTLAPYYPILLAAIACCGILVCIAVRRALMGAIEQLQRLDSWWHIGKEWGSVVASFEGSEAQRAGGRERLSPDHPPLQGSIRSITDHVVAIDKVPFHFIAVWTFALGLTTVTQIDQLIAAFWALWLPVTCAVAISGITLLGFSYRRRGAKLQALTQEVEDLKRRASEI